MYYMTCMNCNNKYVGKTAQIFTERIRQHESHITSKQQNLVAQQFGNEEIVSQQYYIEILDKERT